MKMQFISFYDQNNIQPLPKNKKTVFEKLSTLDITLNDTIECKTHNELLKALGESFEKNNVTVLAIDIAHFIKTKSLLFKAMNIKCVKNEEIIEKIRNDESLSYLNENQVAAQSAIPTQGQAFITKDGLFSGFAIKSDRQIFAVVPLDDNRADNVFADEVYDFILSNIDFEEDLEEIVPENTDDEQEAQELDVAAIPITPQSQETVEKVDVEQFGSVMYETEQDQPLYGAGGVDDLVAETFANISYSKIKLAFGVQDDNVLVDEYFKSKIVFKNNGLFTITNVGKTCVEETEQKNKESLSHVARSAMLNANASIGMAVSEILTDKNGKKYVLSAMCDARKTNIYKIFALPDEEDDDVVIAAIGNMFSVLNSRVMEYNEKMRQKNEEEKEHPVKEKKGKAGRIILIIILLLVLAAAGAAAYAYFKGDGMIYNYIMKFKDIVWSIFQRG